MTNVAVVGSQWGDEGKGKIVDWLSERADVVVRFQGGHNAGHTLVIDGKTYKLSLLPSGVVRGKLSIIGNGVVIDPWALMEEIDTVRKQGVDVTAETLRIAENATLILPLHGALDRARELARGDSKIGTTGRGIGPAYEDKVARRAIRICDLADPASLPEKIDNLLSHHNALLRGLGADGIDGTETLDKLREIAPSLLKYAAPVWRSRATTSRPPLPSLRVVAASAVAWKKATGVSSSGRTGGVKRPSADRTTAYSPTGTPASATSARRVRRSASGRRWRSVCTGVRA